ncbi:MAG: N-acetyltransferase [Xanthomonadales bacterium]|nr:N-acetyltransferase [Xanthomonadales bacterium]
MGSVSAAEWDGLFGGDNPFLRHDFLEALEATACVSPETGWTPQHLVLRREGVVAAAMPLYLKSHSQGEFVFDWAWAEAYARHGLAYYPKLLTAVPFTPSTGPRIACAEGVGLSDVATAVVAAVRERAESLGASGWHLLFPGRDLREAVAAQGLHARHDVQFHWRNRGYDDFEAFLSRLRASRRKSIRKERKQVSRAGIQVRRIAGDALGDREWDAFFRCYRHTYLRRSGHGGYLDRGFFQRLRQTMPESLMLVVAERGDRLLASALFLRDSRRLYGRYWGALEQVDCLHFECCFYQGIEYCIEQGLEVFDPGTQGEHKLLRGFEPTETTSLHWLRDPRFHAAIGDYLRRERSGVREYAQQAGALLPFHRDRQKP